ncbi:unnamed protein product [Nesidiocoris tenuis]|uniref:D-fructose-1,6-bisphosphate 1-phosphohydrolase n=1 Tax=Nesidiocoris tenuis TaxID=355587 RepID=A0A6H5HFU7_9HEMI|nr:unnamed protein product [Nesidiocoris tenuis]
MDLQPFKATLLDSRKSQARETFTLRRNIIADREVNPMKTPKFIMLMESIEMAMRSLIQYNGRARLIKEYLVTSSHHETGNVEEKTAENVILQCLKSSGLVCYAYSSASKKSEVLQRARLKPGNEMLVAGFVVYSSAIALFISMGGNSTQEYIYDEVLGEFIVQDPDVKIPVKGKFYCIDEAQSEMWDQPTLEFVTMKKSPKIGPPKHYKFSGSLCVDMYVCLKYGGILMYPKTLRSPTGTAKLTFEANPMAYIARCAFLLSSGWLPLISSIFRIQKYFLVCSRAAGGLATTGFSSPLDITPEHLHQTVPLYLGSREEVVDLLENVTIRLATK